MSRTGALRLERVLTVVGVLLIVCCGSIQLRARAYNKTSRALARSANGSASQASAESPRQTAHDGSGPILGYLEIPALSLSVAVLPDFDSPSLLHGVGHIHGTAMPGGLGTVGLVGHRDTFFRPLRKVAPGMEILLSDRSGGYRYVVDSTEVVTPDQVSVLAISDRPAMVLVTCYPFDYIGAAPKRFVVHAHLLSLVPDASPARAAS